MGESLLIVDDALFDQHASTSNHPERPARLAAARRGVARSGVRTEALPPADAERALLEKVHAPAYLDAHDALRGVRGMLDADTYVAPRSIEAAVRAAGGAAALGEALARGDARRGLALVRPPGHHAERDRAMGFCLLNNVAIAAEAARGAGAKKIAIVDIDVHHGNGTQTMFWRDPDVLFVSTHQYPFYPGTGATGERGEGPGEGTTVNVPLAEGAGDDVYATAMQRVIAPVLRAFAADVVLVSGGFDAFGGDPLAMMELTADGYASLLAAIAEAAGDRPVGMVLEGGYDLVGLEVCVAASTRALLDSPRAIGPTRAIDRRHALEIDRAAAAARLAWPGVA
ncbi:MAG: histone deacetylase [Polyangiales bacterium]